MSRRSQQRSSDHESTLRQELTRQREAVDAAHARIDELTRELDATNRGVVALHTELEAARAAEAMALAEREVMADHERIARDLHDQVIGRVFGAGMKLQGIVSVVTNPGAARRVAEVITELDAAIQDLRTAIFGLQQRQRAISLRAQLDDLIRQAEEGLGFRPTINLRGPIDAAVPDHIAVDLVAVLREVVFNIARHAQATNVELTLSVGDSLVLEIYHDGRGLDHMTSSGGLADLVRRAEAHGGSFHTTDSPGPGTRLDWRLPLPHHQPGSEAV
jgi:two-component system, NarL family, sensor histidine kinase DevS